LSFRRFSAALPNSTTTSSSSSSSSSSRRLLSLSPRAIPTFPAGAGEEPSHESTRDTTEFRVGLVSDQRASERWRDRRDQRDLSIGARSCVGTSGWARDASYRTVSSPKRLPPPLLDFFVPFSFGTDSAAAAVAAAAAAISKKMFLSASSHLELFLPAESSVGFASTRSQFRYCSTPPTRAKFDGFLRRVGRDLDKRRPILETITTNR